MLIRLMKKFLAPIAFALLILAACNRDDGDFEVEIPDFNFPQTHTFQAKLSSYAIFQGTPSELVPVEGFEFLELSSVLFSDYAHKQRLVKIPEGTQMTKLSDGSIDFPEGTILTKTFFYYNDERDPNLGKRIIETRLLIKENEVWNVATYVWNKAQTEASLVMNGLDLPISWITSSGSNESTVYHVPTKNECMTCHQSNASMSPLGPTLLHLNRDVSRDGSTINQISYLQSLGLMSDFALDQLETMVDYKDLGASLEDRARAYLEMNCAHCHNPDAWSTPAEKNFNFRHDVPFDHTGILSGKDRIQNNVNNGEMPFIGTTMLDKEGVALLNAYIDSL